MRYIQLVVIGLCFALSGCSGVLQNHDAVKWVRLGTLWDTPGIILSVDPQGKFAVVGNESERHLINIYSGEVIRFVDNGEISFSRSGHYAFLYQYISEPLYVSETLALNLETGFAYAVIGQVDHFRTNDTYLISSYRDSDDLNWISSIHNIVTGDFVDEYEGNILSLSRDSSLVVTQRISTDTRNVIVTDIASGAQLAEFSQPISDYIYSASAAFNLNDTLLTIYFFPDEMQVIDTSMWQVLYTLTGAITFSPDGQYIAHNNHADYSEVQLIDAFTGDIIDEFLGSISFSPDGRYWFRGEALTYDQRHWQIIELATNEVVFEDTRFRGSPQIYDDGLVSIWNTERQSTEFFDLESNEFIREIGGGVERFGDYMIVDITTTPFSYLQNWNTEETYAVGRQIEMLPTQNLALVSNGLFVDIYGHSTTDMGELPPPRPDEGIALASIGEIELFAAPESVDVRIITESNMLNPTYMNVLGQTSASDWLYVSFLSYGRDSEWLQGWIRNVGLEEVVAWEHLPILTGQDPIGQLQSLSTGH